ncbi:MAG: Selenide, water dikinase [Planctomycetes bacterium]|nr:Selenide, water dikinase [Planctomycetota bacterium]
MVDDPFQFGRIAAANALSDVYAMGGRPLFALNIVGWPMKVLGPEMLGRVLAGGAAACDEAGISVVGGHTVDDQEPKFGLSVTGTVDPARILRNVGARRGDALFLTKPLGSGILTTVLKRKGLAGERFDRLVETMAALNRSGAEAMLACGARAATDVTGFGLLGHLAGMLRGGEGLEDVGVDVSFSALPLLPGVLDAAREGLVPGGSRKNLAYFGNGVEFDPSLGEAERLVTADAQTSGGILAAIPADRAQEFESKARAAGTLAAARIGTFTADAKRIRVRS